MDHLDLLHYIANFSISRLYHRDLHRIIKHYAHRDKENEIRQDINKLVNDEKKRYKSTLLLQLERVLSKNKIPPQVFKVPTRIIKTKNRIKLPTVASHLLPPANGT